MHACQRFFNHVLKTFERDKHRFLGFASMFITFSCFQIMIKPPTHVSPPASPEKRPGRASGGKAPKDLKILHFTVPQMGLKLMHFCPGIVVDIIRIGRQNISQKITFIFYTNEGVRNP